MQGKSEIQGSLHCAAVMKLRDSGRDDVLYSFLTVEGSKDWNQYQKHETEIEVMKRRNFLKSLASAAIVGATGALPAFAALPKMKITRVRAYQPPNPNPLFNQSDMVVTIETDAGIMGIGEGGSIDTISQSAGRLIGRDPQYIEHLWQDMNRAFFYPAGREKTDGIGALDLALWDIKGKVQKLPVHELLGGMVRKYCECYNTAGIIPGITKGMGMKERAQATMAAGLPRLPVRRGGPSGQHYVQHQRAAQSPSRRMCGGEGRGGQRWRLGDRFSSALRPLRCDPRLQPD